MLFPVPSTVLVGEPYQKWDETIRFHPILRSSPHLFMVMGHAHSTSSSYHIAKRASQLTAK